MKLVKEITEVDYYYGKENFAIENHIKQYHYDSEEEKLQHSRRMQMFKWKDNGQARKMIGGSLMIEDTPPEYTWFGSYSKMKRIDL